MGLFDIKWRESEIIWADPLINLTGLDKVNLEWTGEKPQLAVTNQGDEDEPIWEDIALTTSGADLTHTFSTTGSALKWKVVFVSGQTTITNLTLRGDSSMATTSVITDEGFKIVLNRSFKSSPDYTVPSKMSIGTGTTAASISDTDLENPIYFDSVVLIDACEATTGWSASADGTISLNNTTFIKGVGALNIDKTGTAGATVNFDKTVTSFDVSTAGDAVILALYIKDSAALAKLKSSGTALTITLGTGGYTNSDYWDYTAAALSTGWNRLILDADNPTGSNGSGATLTNVDSIRIAYETNLAADTTTAGDIIMDDWHHAALTDQLADFDVGYPQLDETNLEVTFRATIGSNQANSYLITEIGSFNTDSPDKLYNRAVFSQFSKTQQDELIINVISKLERN